MLWLTDHIKVESDKSRYSLGDVRAQTWKQAKTNYFKLSGVQIPTPKLIDCCKINDPNNVGSYKLD